VKTTESGEKPPLSLSLSLSKVLSQLSAVNSRPAQLPSSCLREFNFEKDLSRATKAKKKKLVTARFSKALIRSGPCVLSRAEYTNEKKKKKKKTTKKNKNKKKSSLCNLCPACWSSLSLRLPSTPCPSLEECVCLADTRFSVSP